MALNFVLASTQTVAMGSGSGAVQNVNGATLMAWFKPATLSGAQQDLIGLSNGIATGSSRCKIAVLATGAIQGNGRCLDADTNRTFAGTAGKVTVGAWSHCCATFDYVNKLIGIYHNGVFDAVSAALLWGAAPTSNTPSLAFNLGSQHGGGSEYANGVIADARCYTKLLTPNEIQTIANGNGHDGIYDNLRHRFMLAELGSGVSVGGAGTVKDSGLLGLHGTPTAGMTYGESSLSYVRKRTSIL